MAHSRWLILFAAPVAVSGISASRTRGTWQSAQAAERQRPYRQVLHNYKDLQYYGNMTVGGQTLAVAMDTGSVDFVVLSKKCAHWCGRRTHFDPVASETYSEGALSLVLSYGSGSLLGKEAYERVALGPLEGAETPFWEVYDASMPLLLRSGFEAIIGLGPMAQDGRLMELGNADNEQKFAVLFKKLGVERYSVCLGAGANAEGFLMWNDPNPEDYPESFIRLTVPVESGYWMVKLQDLTLGDKPIACSRGCGAVIDSGTSLIAAPFEPFSTLSSSIDSILHDCANIAGLPELHFKLDGVPFSLPPDAFVGEVHGKTHNDVAGNFRKPEDVERSCQAALMHVTMDSSMGPVWILGMPFFRKYYTVFSQPTKTSGAALFITPANEECLPATTQEQQLLSVSRGPNGRQPPRAARTIDASALHVPMWLGGPDDIQPGQSLMARTHKLTRGAGRKVVQGEPMPLYHVHEVSNASLEQ